MIYDIGYMDLANDIHMIYGIMDDMMYEAFRAVWGKARAHARVRARSRAARIRDSQPGRDATSARVESAMLGDFDSSLLKSISRALYRRARAQWSVLRRTTQGSGL